MELLFAFRQSRATVAGDRQVRVFDAERALTIVPNGQSLGFSERETCTRVFKCHTGRTKRIVTEESPDVFLTVGEVSCDFYSVNLP